MPRPASGQLVLTLCTNSSTASRQIVKVAYNAQRTAVVSGFSWAEGAFAWPHPVLGLDRWDR